MIHYVHTKFRPILGGHLQTFVELIWNDPHISCYYAIDREIFVVTNTIRLCPQAKAKN